LKKNESIIKCLIEHGAHINDVYYNKNCGNSDFCCGYLSTALTVAIEYKNESLVKNLIEQGANVNMKVGNETIVFT